MDRIGAGTTTLGLLVRAMPLGTVLSTGLMTFQGAGMALAGVVAEFFALTATVTAAGVVGTLCVLALLREVRLSGERGPKGETELTVI
ncbi:hypothetical protein [Streptomyces sp. NPDC006879]|uniref:hypothetical protein n=1 Tax=Streptomyces sp. NPDC006879 TaxID=3364767 RepID=UPI0036C6E0EA